MRDPEHEEAADREPEWRVPAAFETVFRWDYDSERQDLLRLYRKGVHMQWSATERIDWTQDLDPENPMLMPDETIPIYGSDVFERLTPAEVSRLRHHLQAWQISQFLHGEQGALVCSAKIVQQVPSIDAKYYASTQVMDEARHVEAYSRLLYEKLQLVYPINKDLETLMQQVISDRRWDMTYLGMQVLIEGLALAAFSMIRDVTQNDLAGSVNAYVMQDEARHVAFGRLALRQYYPQLTQRERDEREEFVVEACYLMRERFMAQEVWERLGLPLERCSQFVERSERTQVFRTALFSRIVPTVKDIGLWGPRIQKAYTDMGVLGFGEFDLESLMEHDEQIARQYDQRRASEADPSPS